MGFKVAEEKTGIWWEGQGFCFVVQGSDAGVSAMSSIDAGYGYDGIGKSVSLCFDVATDKAHIFQNGDVSTRDDELDPVINTLDAEDYAEIVVK